MVRLKAEEEIRFRGLSEEIAAHPDYQSMKKLIAHGRNTVYDHSINVARLAFKLSSRLHLSCDEKDLVTGALLHDFYLYDWHDASIRVPLFQMHGFTHSFTAGRNAEERFDISWKVKNIIQSHMYPMTLNTPPASREAWTVCLADKIIATEELFRR